MTQLKEQALLERIGELTVTYENKVADLRVELTKITQQLQQVTEELDNYKLDKYETQDVVLEGNVS
jgi:hypothetical protein